MSKDLSSQDDDRSHPVSSEHLYPRALTDPNVTNRESVSASSSSSEHSLDSSSSSSNSLSDEEIEFHESELHPRERSPAWVSARKASVVHKILQCVRGEILDSARSSVGGDPSSRGESPVRHLATEKQIGGEGAANVRVFDVEKRAFCSVTGEEAIVGYKQGHDLILECSAYTSKDVKFFVEALDINAVLCWELLVTQTPDKYQKFGKKCSLTVINHASHVDNLIIERSPPIKIVKLPRLTLIFTTQMLPLPNILPKSVENVSGDTLLYLILQNTICQLEEIAGELRQLVDKVHSDSFSVDSVKNRFLRFSLCYIE